MKRKAANKSLYFCARWGTKKKGCFLFIYFYIILDSTQFSISLVSCQVFTKKKKKMALTVFTPKAFIKCEEADASNYCYKQENKMKAGKMNDFYIDLEEKKL